MYLGIQCRSHELRKRKHGSHCHVSLELHGSAQVANAGPQLNFSDSGVCEIKPCLKVTCKDKKHE